jgi:serine/threonine-protein kinase
MGEVYKAWDPRLERHVALKVLRVYSEDAARRLLREARAQAQVDHPNVCRVYEVGNDPRRPYIAMQYIEGATLDRVAPRMTLEQKVRAVAEVADGVHAAHRIGLIHRDVKPGNVLVEADEDGRRFTPYVVDFGLVLEEDGTRLTADGVVLGTLPFIAPEQADGGGGAAERRSDVYSLGATLYQVLTGRPVFDGSATEQLLKTLGDEPVPPRRHTPDLPRDLETIILKCLEKAPDRRYGTAHELAEDLRRFLDGEAIAARPPGLGERLARKLRKNKPLAAAMAAAAIALAVSGGLVLQAHWQAARRAEVAQRFTAEVKDLEWLLRAAQMSPRHDLRPERGEVRQRMERLREQADALDPDVRGPALYALGRGHLALGEPEAAREYLERARNDGFRPPQAAYALGLAYGRLYDEALEAARGLGDARAQAEAEARAERELGRPALELLEASRGGVAVTPAYLEGLIAFYRGDEERSLAAAAEALERSPWLFEAALLRGDVFSAAGNRHKDAGRHDQAIASYADAEQAYLQAAEVAASAPEPYLRLCSLGLRRVELEQYGRGEGGERYRRPALEHCRRGLEVDADHAPLHSETAALWISRGIELERGREDPLEAFRRAEQHAGRAVELAPGRPESWLHLAAVHADRARYRTQRGEDPSADFEAATAAAGRGARLARNPAVLLNQLGIVQIRIAEYRMSSGVDPSEAVDGAVEALERALELEPSYGYALNNLGRAHTVRSRYEADLGGDPRPSLARSIDAYRAAVRINPENAYAWNNLGVSLTDLGEAALEREEDPTAGLREAAEALRASLAINPEYASAHNNLGLARLHLARFELSRGRDPGAVLDEAKAALDRAAALHRGAFQPHVNLGRVAMVRARHQAAAGEDPDAALDRARAHYADALERNRRYAPGLTELAETWIFEARLRTAAGATAGEALDRAAALLGESLGVDPTAQAAVRLQAELEELRRAAAAGASGTAPPASVAALRR